MLAELHNKISSNGSNLSDRLEDQLTGNVFGSLRYLPFESGLRPLLNRVRFASSGWNDVLESASQYEVDYQFWPKHHEGEIDLLVKVGGTYIGIEVKYFSGLSSDDEEVSNDAPVLIDYSESKNQLANYARMLADISRDQPSYLVFLAPFTMMKSVEKMILSRPIIHPGVSIGFLSWEDVLEAIELISTSDLDEGKKRILEDLQNLLSKKNFTRFKGFSPQIFQETITNECYTYNQHHQDIDKEWKWTTDQIKGDEYYVYPIENER